MNRRCKTPSWRAGGVGGAVLLVAALTWAGGCAYLGVAAQVLDDPNNPAAYELPDVPTLVMVDDPQHHLSNPGLTRQVATTAVHYLRHHEALKKAEFVEPKELAALESRLGEYWSSTPIDEIGRRLGAEQVIYAKVTSATTRVGGGLYQPQGTLEVRVIRVEDAERLWPEPQPLPDPDRPEPGHLVEIELDTLTRESAFSGDATPDDLSRRLADEAGLRLAQLFHKWKKPQPGDNL